ncbi:glycoside hydrolase family 15 protein [Intrasporangium sp. YIM S08009]|uniref:glycoside hydrolase family 15 protein n=1 Tax=Intrasporangium zincisolvens TaxID=3080018 RepID=UPI002B0603BD|nr:glycoside hydrolase family 15 protein [Intrasporangium sp. YIM S08009]
MKPSRPSVTADTSRSTGQPFHVLREYSFVADGHRGALIGPRGDVVWMCVPRWDSPATFASLVGGRGGYTVTPVEPYVWGGTYEPGSLVWRSHWVTNDTTVECREALAAPADPHRAVLLRRIEMPDSDGARVAVSLDLRGDFGSTPADARRDDAGRWVLDCGDLRARWSGLPEASRGDDGVLRAELYLAAGEHRDLVLEVSDRPLGPPVEAPDAWRATERWWSEQVPAFEDVVGRRDARMAYAVLRGLTTSGGGMVAAPTLGLPERAEAGRNFDYRYVWLRDQAYAGLAVSVHEPLPLLPELVDVTTARILEHGHDLAPAYSVTGALPPEESTLDLPAYPGGADVVGNWVRGQFQLDTPGELLQLYASAARHDLLTAEDATAAETLVDVIAARWTQPDAGIWELDPDWWTHSRLACVGGLRRIAQHGPGALSDRADSLADAVLAETSRRCLSPGGAWLRRPGRPELDASLLLPGVRGALAPTDPRSLATIAAVEKDLSADGYLYRNRPDDRPLGEAEGAFLLCGFAMCLAHWGAGHEVEAFRWFERQRAAAGPAGLFAEEFDVEQHQLRGNLPQGFVHALLLECAQRLGGEPDRDPCGESSGDPRHAGTDGRTRQR